MTGGVETGSIRSYSQLKEYGECGWAYYLKRIRRVPVVPAVWLAGGSAFHAVADMVDVAVAEGTSHYAPEPFMNAFRDIFDVEIEEREAKTGFKASSWRAAQVGKVKSRPNGEDREFWYEFGRRLVQLYVEFRFAEVGISVASLDGDLAIEYGAGSLFDLNGVQIAWSADRVMVDDSTGVHFIRDFKSGRRMPPDLDQIGFYSVLVEAKTGTPVTYGDYYNARQGRSEGIRDVSAYTLPAFADKFAAMENSIQAGVFEPKITNLCDWCEVKKYCRHVGGTEPIEGESV